MLVKHIIKEGETKTSVHHGDANTNVINTSRPRTFTIIENIKRDFFQFTIYYE